MTYAKTVDTEDENKIFQMIREKHEKRAAYLQRIVHTFVLSPFYFVLLMLEISTEKNRTNRGF